MSVPLLCVQLSCYVGKCINGIVLYTYTCCIWPELQILHNFASPFIAASPAQPFKAASPFSATIHHTIQQAGASVCHGEERAVSYGACITLSGQSCMHFSIGDIVGWIARSHASTFSCGFTVT